MADKNKIIAEQVLEAVGGSANIVSVTHCMTRLRFVLKDQSAPNKKEVESIKGVMGVNVVGGQYQVIIGNSVGNVYKELLAIGSISDTTADYKDEENKKCFKIGDDGKEEQKDELAGMRKIMGLK